jgi:hypothetical protein
LSAGEKERGRKGETGRRSAPFYGGSAAWAERKGAGDPGAAGDSSGGRHQPPAGGRRCCRVTGEGDGARAADRRDRTTSGPGGQRLGAGGSEREQGSVAWGTDRWARQDNAARFGFKPIQTKSKIFSNRFKILQTLNDLKGDFPCSKN